MLISVAAGQRKKRIHVSTKRHVQNVHITLHHNQKLETTKFNSGVDEYIIVCSPNTIQYSKKK